MHICKWAAGQGDFAEASNAYEVAGDLDSVVRLSLEQLKNPHRAAAIVRKAGSREAAQRLANHCLAARDHQVSTVVLCVSATCSATVDNTIFRSADGSQKCHVS